MKNFLTKTPVIALLIILFLLFLYYFLYLIPYSNNAFVVANIRPVAANVSGYITDIYVKNGEFIKKGQPLFTVFKKPYEYAYQKAMADVAHAKAVEIALTQQVSKTRHALAAKKARYKKWQFDYQRYYRAWKEDAISEIKVNNAWRESDAAYSDMKVLAEELLIEKQNILVQKRKIQSLEAVMKNAKVERDETTVYAKNNGTVQNMFVALGTPIEIRKPLFSFVDMDSLAIQVNMNETELTDVRPGNTVTIIPRIYFSRKIYHGVIESIHWAANRQITDTRTQEQIVNNSGNNWFLLPQRIPVSIKITDYDPEHYPLSPGESAYVYIHT